MTVKDLQGRKIFSSQTELGRYLSNEMVEETTATMTIPPKLLTPGNYCLALAIHIPNVRVLNRMEDICKFTITDMGSEFAIYEGLDYGCVFAECDWKLEQ